MVIKPQEVICGQPAIKVRDILRCFDYEIELNSGFNYVIQKYSLSEREVKSLLLCLYEDGYLEYIDEKKSILEKTKKGRQLTGASAAKPIKRATADKVLKELIDRVNYVNSTDVYAYKVKKVTVFGSYLSDKEYIGDIDVCVELERFTTDDEEFFKRKNERIGEAKEKGRRFNSDLGDMFWPYNEVLIYLKNHKRSLSIVEADVLEQVQTEKKVVFDMDKQN